MFGGKEEATYEDPDRNEDDEVEEDNEGSPGWELHVGMLLNGSLVHGRAELMKHGEGGVFFADDKIVVQRQKRWCFLKPR